MLDYSVRLKRKYQCPVIQVVIFLQETTNQIVFTQEYRDETTLHQYQVVRLWEQNSEEFLNNSALLPLAVLTQTNSPNILLRQVAQKIAMITNTEQRQNIASCTEIFAGLRFDQTLIHQFFKEDMMKESVIYQDILRKGKQAEALLLVTRLINRRFGEIDPLLMQTVESLSVEQLESLIEEMLTIITIDQLREWLNSL